MKKIPTKVKIITSFALIMFSFALISQGLQYSSKSVSNKRVDYNDDEPATELAWDDTYNLDNIGNKINKIFSYNITAEGKTLQGGTIVPVNGVDRYITFMQTRKSLDDDGSDSTFTHILTLDGGGNITNSQAYGAYDFNHGNDLSYNPADGYVYVLHGATDAGGQYKLGRFKIDNGSLPVSNVNIDYAQLTHGTAGIAFYDNNKFYIYQGNNARLYENFNYMDSYIPMPSYLTNQGIAYRNDLLYLSRFEAGKETTSQKLHYYYAQQDSNLVQIFNTKDNNCSINDDGTGAYKNCTSLIKSYYIPKTKVNGELEFVSFFSDGKMLLGFMTYTRDADGKVPSDTTQRKIELYKTTFSVDDDVVIPVKGISLNKASDSVNVGETTQVTATISPSNAANKAVTWSSSNTNVATVSNGTITGVSAGTATITATSASDNTIKKSMTITVNNVEVTGVSLDKTSETINPGKTVNLTATVAPSNATNKTITWSSSNTNVATVSNGAVTGVVPGTATITATSNNGKKATATITVRQGPTLAVEYNEEDTYTEVIITANSDSDLREVSGWTLSTDKRKLTKRFTDSQLATTISVCNTYDNCTTASIKALTLKKQNITFAENTVVRKLSDESYTQEANVLGDARVTYNSSDETIATVDNSGKVTFIKQGTVIITATAEKTDEYYKGTTNYELIIGKNTQKLSFPATSITKSKSSGSYVMEASHTAGDGEVTYISTNPLVATVDNTGKVTILDNGTSVIIATASETETYYSISASYTLNVSERAQELFFEKSSITKKLSDEQYTMKVTRKTGDGEITYSSSDENVATVNNTGKVTIKGIGQAVITATAASTESFDEASASYTLNIQKGESEIIIDGDIKDEIVKKPTDEAFKINAILKKGNGTLKYQSSDVNVATVDNDGNVTIVGEGLTTITISVEETDKYMPASKTIQLRVGEKKDEEEVIVPDTGKNIPFIVFIVSAISIGIGFIMINKTNKSKTVNK